MKRVITPASSAALDRSQYVPGRREARANSRVTIGRKLMMSFDSAEDVMLNSEGYVDREWRMVSKGSVKPWSRHEYRLFRYFFEPNTSRTASKYFRPVNVSGSR